MFSHFSALPMVSYHVTLVSWPCCPLCYGLGFSELQSSVLTAQKYMVSVGNSGFPFFWFVGSYSWLVTKFYALSKNPHSIWLLRNCLFYKEKWNLCVGAVLSFKIVTHLEYRAEYLSGETLFSFSTSPLIKKSIYIGTGNEIIWLEDKCFWLIFIRTFASMETSCLRGNKIPISFILTRY